MKIRFQLALLLVSCIDLFILVKICLFLTKDSRTGGLLWWPSFVVGGMVVGVTSHRVWRILFEFKFEKWWKKYKNNFLQVVPNFYCFLVNKVCEMMKFTSYFGAPPKVEKQLKQESWVGVWLLFCLNVKYIEKVMLKKIMRYPQFSIIFPMFYNFFHNLICSASTCCVLPRRIQNLTNEFSGWSVNSLPTDCLSYAPILGTAITRTQLHALLCYVLCFLPMKETNRQCHLSLCDDTWAMENSWKRKEEEKGYNDMWEHQITEK